MRIFFSQHALKRMDERKISKAQISKAFDKPFATLPTIDKHRRRIMADIDNEVLDIIYVPKKDKVLIVTIAWLRQEDRKVCL